MQVGNKAWAWGLGSLASETMWEAPGSCTTGTVVFTRIPPPPSLDTAPA